LISEPEQNTAEDFRLILFKFPHLRGYHLNSSAFT
jgi:hypothetical protein